MLFAIQTNNQNAYWDNEIMEEDGDRQRQTTDLTTEGVFFPVVQGSGFHI